MRPAGVEVWLVDLERDGERLAAMAAESEVLDATDRARQAGYRDARAAQDLAASRAALNLVLSRYSDEPLARMQRSRSGKPVIPGVPMFSLARTRGYAAVAVAAKGEVGIDIERLDDRSPDHPAIDRIAEVASVDPLTAWTIVEAWVKLQGMTLGGFLDSTGQARILEDAIVNGGQGVMTLLQLAPDITGCCWHTMLGTDIVVRPFEMI